MVVEIDIKVDTSEVDSFIQNLPVLKRSIYDAAHKFAEISASSVGNQLISQTKKASRTAMRSQITANRPKIDVSQVSIPLNAHYLDSMRSHYVSLKPGRRITDWTKKYYVPDNIKTGRSRVQRNNRGEIKGGYIYATADPFVDEGLKRVENRLMPIVNQAIKQHMR